MLFLYTDEDISTIDVIKVIGEGTYALIDLGRVPPSLELDATAFDEASGGSPLYRYAQSFFGYYYLIFQGSVNRVVRSVRSSMSFSRSLMS